MSKCAMCGSKMNKAPERVFHYTACGLPKIFLKGVVIYQCTNNECREEEVGIPNLEELHQLIAEKIALQSHKLRLEEIRFLRTHLGYSGKNFAQAMGVSAETVSRWEKGNVNMKETSERLLRVLILTKAGPFRNYGELKDLASKETKTSSKHIFKVSHTHWAQEDKLNVA